MSFLPKFIVLICLFPAFLSAQIVNTEKLRVKSKEGAWEGEIDFNLGLSRNKAGQTFQFRSNARFDYLKKHHKWMIMGDYQQAELTRLNDPDQPTRRLKDQAFGHIRYNYLANPHLRWEAFGQIQFNDIQDIRLRTLLGTGPRVKILRTDSSQVYFGTLIMFEYEESRDEPLRLTFHRDFRLSSYLSLAYRITDVFAINHVSYYQPNVADWADFRISSETQFQFLIRHHLSFKTHFNYMYDAKPAGNVPPVMFSLINGFAFTF
jgi:hypothetical protein